MKKRPRRIISGGQTGADRGGLDAAMDLGIAHGGWCPKGRRAEDGRIPGKYRLRETDSSAYPVRTERNVEWADGTVVFTFGKPKSGSALTLALAGHHLKPHVHIDLAKLTAEEAALKIREWMEREGVGTLNVAGSREGSAAGIQRLVWKIMKDVYSR